MRAASKRSNVSLRRHAMEKPFTVRYEGTDVSIPCAVKIHFKNVVSPGSQLKRANLRRDYHHYKAKEIATCTLKWAIEVLHFWIAAYKTKSGGNFPATFNVFNSIWCCWYGRLCCCFPPFILLLLNDLSLIIAFFYFKFS